MEALWLGKAAVEGGGGEVRMDEEAVEVMRVPRPRNKSRRAVREAERNLERIVFKRNVVEGKDVVAGMGPVWSVLADVGGKSRCDMIDQGTQWDENMMDLD
jgi:hypothetical protein